MPSGWASAPLLGDDGEKADVPRTTIYAVQYCDQ